MIIHYIRIHKSFLYGSTMYLEGNYSPVLVDIHNITFYDVQDFFVYDFYTNI